MLPYIFNFLARQLCPRAFIPVNMQSVFYSVFPIAGVCHPFKIACMVVCFVSIFMIDLRVIVWVGNVHFSNKPMHKSHFTSNMNP